MLAYFLGVWWKVDKRKHGIFQGHHRQLQKQQHLHKEHGMIDSMEHSVTEGVAAALPLRCFMVMAAKKAVALHTTNAFLSHRST